MKRIAAPILVALTSVLVASVAVAPAAGADVNDWSCQPTALHPRPVVLLHGLGGTAEGNWAYVGPRLVADGYCTFALTYGRVQPGAPYAGFGPIAESALEIAEFIHEVLAATGAAEVDIVGHSEGGFLSLYVPKVHGLGDEVAHVVALAPPTHSTTASGLLTPFTAPPLQEWARAFVRLFGCHACDDLVVSGGSVVELTDGPIAMAGIDYTIIASRLDLLVTPTETSFVREPGVRNVLVQDLCPFDLVGHVGLAFDSGVYDMITNGLDPSSAAPVRCSLGLPI
jgi:triacylglycerol esterase/lipase EstA (alpha/beta hydrolase family)